LWLTGLVICGLLVRLIGQAYYGLYACFFVAFCRLIAAYWSGLLWLTGLVICGLLVWLIMAYLPGSLLLTAGLLPLIGLAYYGLLWRPKSE
jgi:hypothetical protein